MANELAPVLAVGTQFLTLPSTAQELAIGSHYYSSSINPALYNAPKNNQNSLFHEVLGLVVHQILIYLITRFKLALFIFV